MRPDHSPLTTHYSPGGTLDILPLSQVVFQLEMCLVPRPAPKYNAPNDYLETSMPTTTTLPDLISQAQTTEEQFLRHIFVRDQMAEWSKNPLVMARADGVHYWDVHGKRYLDALSGIYVVSVGHNNRRVIEAVKRQLDALHFSPPMHGTYTPAVQLAALLAELAPGDLAGVNTQ